jgi:cytoskeleton protein RodZ
MMDEVEGAAFEGADHMPKTAGQRLREAREAAGMSLEDVATATRIPTRHLESLEKGDFAKLPAPTYSIGFARSYATAVGLDRAEIGDQLRAELGGDTRPSAFTADGFEPADPARAFPKWLLLAAVIALVLVLIGARWWQSREYAEDGQVFADNAPPAAAPAEPQPAAPSQAVASGPVTLTATEEVWIQVKDGATTLREGVLKAGESFAVPASATAPQLTTGKPEALRVAVGTAEAPPVGPPATTVSNVSLLARDLMARRPASPPAQQ